MKKLIFIFLNFLPVIGMVILIPLIKGDYLLALTYVACTIFSLVIYYERNDILVFFLGMIALTISEAVFIATGVEEFKRISLFGIMPVWLPILWGFGFIAIKRTVIKI